MSDQLILEAEARTEFGKGASRRARAAGKIPAVLYGHGTDPRHVLLPGHATTLALKHSNALLSIVVGKDSELVIVKDVQTDPVHQVIEHIDLLIVKKGEKLAVDVPVHLMGESFPGTLHVLEHATIRVLAEATHLPESVEVSIEGLVDGDKIHAGEVVLPEGVELQMDPEALVVGITHQTRVEEPVVRAEAEVAAEAAAAAEASAESESSEE
ncbi:MAG: 50S ribosomal protein L25/general stress protein Ctc [Demequinaceae bacterium]|nr:50S ribosomal protein L25/general stress protein Ctc [Demequinaceae bacterium]